MYFKSRYRSVSKSNRFALVLCFSLIFVLVSCAEKVGGSGGDHGPVHENPVGNEVGDPAGNDPVGNDPANCQDGADSQNGTTCSSPDGAGESSALIACGEISATGSSVHVPVDILWVVDTSGSMESEVALIEQRLNDFAALIGATGIDFHVVLIAGELADNQATYDICIGPPLSGQSVCPDEDGPRYRHVRHHVASQHALSSIIDTYPAYQDFLRDDAMVHMIGVSDDESSLSASQFELDVLNLAAPGFANGFVFHSIVSGEYPEDEWVLIPGLIEIGAGCDGPYGQAVAYGEQYVTLSERTGGVFAEICNADWDGIFDAIAHNVLLSSQMPCAFDFPTVPEGLRVSDVLSATLTLEDQTTLELGPISGPEACSTQTGWYFDNPQAPTQVRLCPASCGELDAHINISLGCSKG